MGPPFLPPSPALPIVEAGSPPLTPSASDRVARTFLSGRRLLLETSGGRCAVASACLRPHGPSGLVQVVDDRADPHRRLSTDARHGREVLDRDRLPLARTPRGELRERISRCVRVYLVALGRRVRRRAPPPGGLSIERSSVSPTHPRLHPLLRRRFRSAPPTSPASQSLLRALIGRRCHRDPLVRA